MNLNGFFPAKILRYDAAKRTAQVAIVGLTDGATDGLTATLAYPIGHDDHDTEIQLLAGAEVYVFFAGGQADSPVIAFYRSHGVGAAVGVRRIRQEKIELIADAILMDAANIEITGDVHVLKGIVSDMVIKALADVLANTTSLKAHVHGGVRSGLSSTLPPI